MRGSFVTLAVALAFAATGPALAAPEPVGAPVSEPSRPVDPRVRNLLARLPLAFETNRGQAPEGWDFLVRCRGYHAFVASDAVVFSFDGAGLRMSLDGAARCEPETRGLELSGKANYFLGNDPSKWISNVPLSRGAVYRDAAPGTTWTFGSAGRALDFGFDLGPGVAGPSLRLEGALGVRVAGDGALRIAMPHGIATFSAPVAWQDLRDRRLPAAARWVIEMDGAVRIDVAARDTARSVHVDPTVTYESYLGSAGFDGPTGAEIDSTGASYYAAKTNSAGFPTTNGAYDTSLSGTYDVVVTKVDSGGSALVYSTYIGGTSEDTASGLALDSAGNAYVAGYTGDSTYPTTAGVYKTTATGNFGFITELNSSGTGLVFSTFTDVEAYTGPVLGAGGSTYVIEGDGVSNYTSGGVSQAFHRQIRPASYSGLQVEMHGLVADSSGDVYVVGRHGTPTFSATTGAYQTTRSGNSDAYATKISSAGTLIYTTFLGGSADDSGTAIGVNWQGEAFIAGTTTSSNFPYTSDGLSVTGSEFVARLNSTGTALRFATRLGDVNPFAIRVHPSGAFVVAGRTDTSNAPISNAFQSTRGNGTDGVVMKFNADRTLAWCSYWGGSGSDVAAWIGMAPDGSIAVAGSTTSDDVPTVNAYQSQRVGGNDNILLVVPDTLPTTLTPPTIGSMTLPDWTVNRPYSKTIVPLGGLAPYAFTIKSGAVPPGLTLSSGGVLSGMPTQTGTFTFSVDVSDAPEMTASGTVTIRINAQPAITSATLQGWTVGVACDQAIPVTGGSAPFTFALTTGPTPAGLTLAADGRLIGTPTTLGIAGFTVTATDAAGATATRPVTFRVNDAPSVNATVPPPCTETRPYLFQFTTTEGTAPFTWTLVTGTAPASLTASGRLEGATRQAGAYSFTIRATDAAGIHAERAFEAVSNPLPQVVNAALPPAAVGRPYQAQLTASGGTVPFVWSVQSGSLPGGISLDPSTGALHGDLVTAGGGPVAFRATDGCGALAARTLDLDAADEADLSKGKSSAKQTYAAGAPSHSVHYLEAVAGATIGISAKGGSKDGVLPTLVLTDPDGRAVDLTLWTKASPKAITVKGFVAPVTGRYFITFTPAPGFEGKAKLSVTLKPRNVWSSGASLTQDTQSEYAFAAPPGAKVSITVKAEKGSTALPRIVSFSGPDAADLLPTGVVTESTSTATFKSTSPLTGGDYKLVFSTRDASAGPVTWIVKLALPKKYEFALPDLAAGALGN